MEKKEWLLGIDLGGTTVKLAFVEQEGTVIHKWEIPTNLLDNGMHIVTEIASSVKETLKAWPNAVLIAAGMGAPGPVDFETGSIYVAVNIGWRDYPLKSLLEDALGIPVVVDNDANMASYGEFWKGTGEGTNDLVCITLGTGVGGGIIANQELVHGVSGAGGELGHITVIPEGGAPCNCGKTGCIETIASATGIVRLALEEINKNPESQIAKRYHEQGIITAKDVFDCVKEEDEASSAVLDQVAKYLGLTAANVGNSLNPDKIVFGGGVSRAGELLLGPVRRYYEQFAFPRVAESTVLECASLGNDAGVIGAAGLAYKQYGNE
ncbi:glucokinase [Bacillus sp. FJAT-27916]|uniref:ROK family glucokinase n=1 Tax=Bacillaceae TaxID=186817 RepID=UPI000670B9A6|nr:ROK family glucokinase [Bacillus sp. FJAT-27916]KMY43766.1 glucokinase [Bacillus sp. FJAT-27916]